MIARQVMDWAKFTEHASLKGREKGIPQGWVRHTPGQEDQMEYWREMEECKIRDDYSTSQIQDGILL